MLRASEKHRHHYTACAAQLEPRRREKGAVNSDRVYALIWDNTGIGARGMDKKVEIMEK